MPQKLNRPRNIISFLAGLCVSAAAFSQRLSPTTPAREFVRANGQLMAVENNASIPTPPIAGYKYSLALTINGTKATANLTNFPVLVAQTIPMLANVANGGHVQNANGYDILFAANVSGIRPSPPSIAH